MKNQKGLKRFQTIWNGFLHIGKRLHSPHESINDEVYVIQSKDITIELTEEEALVLAYSILISFKGVL